MAATNTQALVTQSGSKMIDEFLRRELRVGDPRNPAEISAALRRRYGAEAARLDQESAGLPVALGAPPPMFEVAPEETPGSREARRVGANLEADLAELIDDPANREWKPELNGWRSNLVRELADGQAAAVFARDVAKRERGFLSVRRLSEYARVARLIGVLSPDRMTDYRRLATTLDDATGVLRVLMGESLYRAGLSDGGLITQFPLVDLRQRRDSLVLALRRLGGVVEDENDWGDATASYSALLDSIDAQSAPELRAYLREEMLAAILDDLTSNLARQDPDSLRQLAATSPVEVARLGRLLLFASSPALPPSPALSNFVQNLKLFLESFGLTPGSAIRTRSGARLIDLAVPLPIAAQQADEADAPARQTLRELVNVRYAFAQEVECFARCPCDPAKLGLLVKLDTGTHVIDRAIDLYAQGDGLGDEEARAGGYGAIASQIAVDPAMTPALLAQLARLDALHLEVPLFAAPNPMAILIQIAIEQNDSQTNWHNLALSLAPRCG